MLRLRIAAVIAAAVMFGCAGQADAQSASQDINITANVAKYCTIGGTATTGGLNTTIPVSAAGAVTTTAQVFTITSVVCNTATNLTAGSVFGGVKSAATAPAGFTNIIDYTGKADFGGVSSTINTATIPTAIAAEVGNTVSTGGPASGSLVVTITPATPTKPLVAGTDYGDILRINLTPQ